MTGGAERGNTDLVHAISTLCGAFVPDDPFLMRVVTGRTRDAAARHQGEDDQFLFLGLLDVAHHLLGRPYEEVSAEKRIRHGRMTAPAEETDIGPEGNVARKVRLGVGHFLVAQETDRPAFDLPDVLLPVKHDVRVDVGIQLL